MLIVFNPDHMSGFILGTGRTPLIYGMVGLLVSVLLARNTGVYLILFRLMIDFSSSRFQLRGGALGHRGSVDTEPDETG